MDLKYGDDLPSPKCSLYKDHMALLDASHGVFYWTIVPLAAGFIRVANSGGSSPSNLLWAPVGFWWGLFYGPVFNMGYTMNIMNT